MLRIAHRGAKGYAPENTMTAFRRAIELGADGIELDVHLSADGQIVVLHDTTLDRTTTGSGAVADMSWEAIVSCPTRDGEECVPLLGAVFDLIGPNFLLNIELKTATAVQPVLYLIEAYVDNGFSPSQFLISSFDWVALQDVRRSHPEIPLGVLTQTDLELAVGFARSIGAETIHPYYHLLTKEKVRQLQEEGFRVVTWTVNEPEDIAQVRTWGVDGIISDYPDRL